MRRNAAISLEDSIWNFGQNKFILMRTLIITTQNNNYKQRSRAVNQPNKFNTKRRTVYL